MPKLWILRALGTCVHSISASHGQLIPKMEYVTASSPIPSFLEWFRGRRPQPFQAVPRPRARHEHLQGNPLRGTKYSPSERLL